MTTATEVPPTRGELEGDEAFETLRPVGRRRLVADSVTRFRAADGFSHSRALAFQLTLTLLPALIAVVGLAAALDQEDFRRVVHDTVRALAPGAAGDILTDALRQGSASARRESGETALVAGAFAAVLAGTAAMAQVERGANRIYGVERDRPFARKYVRALLLALSAGLLAVLSLVILMGGAAIRDAADWTGGLNTVWRIARWPSRGGFRSGLRRAALRARAASAPAGGVLARVRRCRVGSALAGVHGPAGRLHRRDGFVRRHLRAARRHDRRSAVGFPDLVALFLGLAFAAQLEAVRAGVAEPRLEQGRR